MDGTRPFPMCGCDYLEDNEPEWVSRNHVSFTVGQKFFTCGALSHIDTGDSR